MASPFIVSTWSFGRRGNDVAWRALIDGGTSLDAVETVCRVVEADEEVDSVGYGGLTDRDGKVTLDGTIMLAPNRCGSVCAIRRFGHPVSIARRVMEASSHVMLAGEGADAFAAAQGFEPAELVADDARRKWEQWTARPHDMDQSRDSGIGLRPIDRNDGGRLFHHDPVDVNDESRWTHHDTIGVLAIDGAGALAGACSSSGMPYKLPGRVGDSPIIGHGLYVEPTIGAAVATGQGELIMGVCGSFLAVERLRAGDDADAAVRHVLQRIINTYELTAQDQVGLIVLTPAGEWSAGALRGGFKISVTRAAGSDVVDPTIVMLPD